MRCSRTARLSCAQADAESWRCGSMEIEISPQRRGLTAARLKPTPHHGVDTKSQREHPANRSGTCPHRCAVAALRHNVALCAASQASRTAGRAAASAAVRAARRITHVMSSVGSASRSGPRSSIAGERARNRVALAPTRMGKHGRVLRTPPHVRTAAMRLRPRSLAVECTALRVESHRVFVTSTATR
jgi:hypothetical protein